MMAVPVAAAGTSFEAGTPVALFPTRIVEGGSVVIGRPHYAVARDGPGKPGGQTGQVSLEGQEGREGQRWPRG